MRGGRQKRDRNESSRSSSGGGGDVELMGRLDTVAKSRRLSFATLQVTLPL